MKGVNLSLSQSYTEVLIEHDLIFEEAICQMDPFATMFFVMYPKDH